MKKVLKNGFGLLIGTVLVILLAACGPAVPSNSTLPIPTTSPESGRGAISGLLAEASQIWPDEPLLIYAVPFYSDQTDPGQGFYVLDTSIHSMTELAENGAFRINNVSPGIYVLVAGPRAEDSLLAVNPDQSPLIIEVIPDQVTTLQNLELAK